MNIDGHEVERRWIDACAAADLAAEFVRREAAEKAAVDAAHELDRRAAIVRKAWIEADCLGSDIPWSDTDETEKGWWRACVRALDADAAEQEALSE